MTQIQERSWIEIDLGNYTHNIRAIRAKLASGARFLQIVKADAYGHGAYEIARRAIREGASFLGVANSEEGMLLRYLGITIPIIILSPCLDTEISTLIEYDLTPSVSDIEFTLALDRFCEQKNVVRNVHVNVDTGMGRSGIYFADAGGMILKIASMKNLKIQGIFSHFAASENDSSYTRFQIQRFESILKQLPFTPEYVHMANSSAIVTAQIQFCNLARVGILGFGVYTDHSIKHHILLKPVMVFKSRISQVKHAYPGDSIGYNRTYTCEQRTRYAIVPVGYADGYDYLLSNKGEVLVRGKKCRILGKISMDMIAIDITQLDSIAVGDEVTLMGGEQEAVRCEHLAGLYNGSSYELLCQIGRRARRYYREEGKTISTSPLSRRGFVSKDFTDDKLGMIIESAISQRLQSKEIGSIINDVILKRFFIDRDREIHYKKDFLHTVRFEDSDEYPDYFRVYTELTFTKILQSDFFYVACAHNEEVLEKYFMRKDVEYRWLLDSSVPIMTDSFNVTRVCVNNHTLHHHVHANHTFLEIRCFHEILTKYVGQEVCFSISTQTYYPRIKKQLSIYISEMTKEAGIHFIYPQSVTSVETVPFFSGKTRFPAIHRSAQAVKIHTASDEWIFPTSGVVFVYASVLKKGTVVIY